MILIADGYNTVFNKVAVHINAAESGECTFVETEHSSTCLSQMDFHFISSGSLAAMDKELDRPPVAGPVSFQWGPIVEYLEFDGVVECFHGRNIDYILG